MKTRILITYYTCLLCATLANAEVIVFTDRNAWESVHSSYIEENFDSSLNGQTYRTLSGGTIHHLGLVDFFYNGSPQNGPCVAAVGTLTNGAFGGDVWLPSKGGGTTSPGPNIFRFPSFVTAWGADFLTGGNQLTVAVANQVIRIDDFLDISNGGFLGLTSDIAFWKIVFNRELTGPSFNSPFLIDNFRFAAVPEPSTMLLLSAGIAGIAGWRKKSQKK